MAVLKDLIVHGPSKFIGKTQFNTINAGSIGAREGIFNKLIATTLKAETATIDDLTAKNATVVGLLDVQGELHTNAWTNANIANIGGSFYISPSVESVGGKITINKNTSNWTVQITGKFATDFIKTAGATTASAWPANSLVLVTGNVVVNKMNYPLGTLKGKLTGQVDATAASTEKTITMTCASDYTDNPNADVLQMLYEANGNANITTADFSNGKISMYKISGTKPIGILLSSVGITAKGSNYIDIYGGTNNDGTPNLRIGHLTGLSAITLNGKSMTPTGWGLYADNAYLSGTIHSAAGIIGGFTIGSTNIHNGKTSRTETTNNGVWVGTDGIGFGKGITYFSTDGTGKIGPWDLSTTYIRNGSVANATNTTVAGVYLGKDGLNISNGTAATTAYITKTAVNIGNKLTWNGTTLSVNGTVTASSGTIGGWTIGSTFLSTSSSGTPGSGVITLSKGIAGPTTATGVLPGGLTWAFTAGNQFGVTTGGKLYATGAVITGEIKATSGYFKNIQIKNSNDAVVANIDSTSKQLTFYYNSSGTTVQKAATFGSNGIILYKNNSKRVEITSTGMDIFSDGENKSASFGENVVVGLNSRSNITLGANGFSIHRSNDLIVDIGTGTGSVISGVTSGVRYVFCHYNKGLIPGLEPGTDSDYESEGYGFCSITEGGESYAIGDYSHASGRCIVTRGSCQTAIGKFNNNNTDNAFEIGWGTADNARKNIFAVGTDGTVKINETNMNDFVVEQGNGYRKWNSGLAECWVNTTQNVAINSAYGSLYQGTWTWSFAITFKGNPAVTCSHFKWGTGASWGTVSASSTTNAVLRGFDVVSRTAGSCNITAYAIGRWK